MQIKEYRTTDKSAWGPGPWQDEPDKAQWQDEATGLASLMVRNGSGALCGYVGVTAEHPLYGVEYNACPIKCGADSWECQHRPESILSAHGGITFSGACQKWDDEGKGVCHLPDPGEPDSVWWFGFDCAHAWDLRPADDAKYPGWRSGDEIYRGLGYVKAEIAELAQHLARMTA